MVEIKEIVQELKQDIKEIKSDMVYVKVKVAQLDIKSGFWGALGAVVILLPTLIIYFVSK